jgi:glycosyltransferase involved in cell wall biosynthesis
MNNKIGQNGKNRSHIIVGIPAYNEEQFVADVVIKSRKFADEVVVVNDGSTDNTAMEAKAAMATVINKDYRCGYGGSISTCMKIAKENVADILVTIDGDGQNNADEIPLLIFPILEGKADLVVGSRFLKEQDSVPRYRKFGIKAITSLYNFASKVKISDAQSGFRAYSYDVLKDYSPTEKGMAISVETLVYARHKGFTIKEVPISCIYHKGSHKSNPVIHGLSVALKLIKIRLKYR